MLAQHLDDAFNQRLARVRKAFSLQTFLLQRSVATYHVLRCWARTDCRSAVPWRLHRPAIAFFLLPQMLSHDLSDSPVGVVWAQPDALCQIAVTAVVQQPANVLWRSPKPASKVVGRHVFHIFRFRLSVPLEQTPPLLKPLQCCQQCARMVGVIAVLLRAPPARRLAVAPCVRHFAV